MTTPTNAGPITLGDFDGFLTPEQSAPIFERASRQSAVQSLATRVPLSPNGRNVPVVVGRPKAGWVNEGEAKPITSGGMTLKNLAPHKIAGIFTMSAETVRSNPGNVSTQMRNDMAAAIASAFDAAALHGDDSPFTTNIDQTPHTVTLEGASSATANGWTRLNEGLSQLVNDRSEPFTDGRRLSGFVFDTTAEPVLNSSLDTAGRPLFVDTPLSETDTAVRPGRVMGRPSVINEGVGNAETLGYGGDWSQVVWGTVGGISFKVSTDTTLPIGPNGEMISLFQHNLVAVLCEAEYGFLINDVNSFVRYTRAAEAGA